MAVHNNILTARLIGEFGLPRGHSIRFLFLFSLALFLFLHFAPGRLAVAETIITADCSDIAPRFVGQEVPSFYVRAVTGPFAGRSVCYVCRHGDRPVVMVFVRDINRETTQLIKQLDTTANRHRGVGLRCFVVMLTATPQRDSPRLQTLAFDEKLDLPLTIASQGIATDLKLTSHDDMQTTVVLYQDRRIVRVFEHSPGTCGAESRQEIVEAAESLVKNTQ